MNNFNEFSTKLRDHFNALAAEATRIYEIDCDKDELWNLYLDSFPAGTNKIYRERREMDCSACRHFMRTAGNMAFLVGDTVKTLWDFNTESTTYQPVVNALSRYLHSKPITDVFFTKEFQIGKPHDREMLADGTIMTWNHMFVTVPVKFVDRSGRSEGDVKNEFRTMRNVFKRSLDEISPDAVETVLELIADGSLYRGEEWKANLLRFRDIQKEYRKMTDEQKEIYTWKTAESIGAAVGRIRNHSIGVLLTDITDGMELDSAVRRYEQIVAPANYKRPKAVFTKVMLERAKSDLSEMGYMQSLGRRYATLDDIRVHNILFCNRDVKSRIQGAANVFDEMMIDARKTPKKFDRAEEVSIERFVTEILPAAKSVEAYIENRHSRNFVSLIAPENADAPTMFKWNNPFGWAYTGNITDSDIRENVKKAGGNTDGVLRFSIQWNDEEYNGNDFDAHCQCPGEHIFFGHKHDRGTDGELDVDIIHPNRGTPAVENIVFPYLEKMKTGTYQFSVHCYNNNGYSTGFKAEIEMNGEVFRYEYDNRLKTGETVKVAEVSYHPVTGFSIKHYLSANQSVNSREIWGIKTMDFVPVTTVMYSPNYWDDQNGIGNKHYMFMLKDCVNSEQPNGFYNEFLKQELVQNKRVFEALGSKMAVEYVDDQLSGLGFSSTLRNDLIVKVKGTIERVIKIKF